MNIFFILQPRQSGKTTVAISEFLLDPERTVFVSPNFQCARDASKRSGAPNRLFISANNFTLKMRGHRPYNIIMDEYLYYENIRELYSFIPIMETRNLYIFTSAKKQYERRVFEYVKYLKLNGQSYHEIIGSNRNTDPHIQQEIEELYFNHITDPGIVLIDNAFHHDTETIDRMTPRDGYQLERFRAEILNQYLKN